MSKDINFKQISSFSSGATTQFKRYAGFTFFIGILCIYGFLVFQIGSLSQAEPSEADIAQQNTVKRLKLDQSAIKKIEQLEDQNVGVQSLFDTARENPFVEE